MLRLFFLNFSLDTNDSSTRHYFDTGFWTDVGTTGSLTTRYTQDYRSSAFHRLSAGELLIVAHKEGTSMGTAEYDFLSNGAA